MANPPKISEHVRQRTKEWLRKAEHELAYLTLAPFDLDDPPTDTACRMSHMVAEYALKAYLVLNKHKILKSHDLVDILNSCIAIHNDTDFEDLRDDCLALTDYRKELTYPGPMPISVDISEAEDAIKKAQMILEFVTRKAEELGYYR